MFGSGLRTPIARHAVHTGVYCRGHMSSDAVVHHLRADARRNRDAILVAARNVFSEHGLGAPLELVAKSAGVGRATLYRRFPTRDHLIQELCDADLEELSKAAAACEQPDQVLRAILEQVALLHTQNASVVELFTTTAASPDVIQRVMTQFDEFVETPLRDAQAAGSVRADITAKDVGTVLLMLAATGPALRDDTDAKVRRDRAWQLMLDALDPARAPRPLPA